MFVLTFILLGILALPSDTVAEALCASDLNTEMPCVEDAYFACWRIYTSCGIGTAQYCTEWYTNMGINEAAWASYLEFHLCD